LCIEAIFDFSLLGRFDFSPHLSLLDYALKGYLAVSEAGGRLGCDVFAIDQRRPRNRVRHVCRNQPQRDGALLRQDFAPFLSDLLEEGSFYQAAERKGLL
jgi:hypothetical protein